MLLPPMQNDARTDPDDGHCPEVVFRGVVRLADGRRRGFVAQVRPPVRLENGWSWGCRIYCSQHGIAITVAAGEPRQAYADAFDLLRSILVPPGAALFDSAGRPLALDPPG